MKGVKLSKSVTYSRTGGFHLANIMKSNMLMRHRCVKNDIKKYGHVTPSKKSVLRTSNFPYLDKTITIPKIQ